jgi:hypothetical protein
VPLEQHLPTATRCLLYPINIHWVNRPPDLLIMQGNERKPNNPYQGDQVDR